jgi:rhodanese-related sulfurtransferase
LLSAPTGPKLRATFDAGVILLDVREDDEWACGHAPSARHITMGQVTARRAEIDSDAQVVVFRAAGARSLRMLAWGVLVDR